MSIESYSSFDGSKKPAGFSRREVIIGAGLTIAVISIIDPVNRVLDGLDRIFSNFRNISNEPTSTADLQSTKETMIPTNATVTYAAEDDGHILLGRLENRGPGKHGGAVFLSSHPLRVGQMFLPEGGELGIGESITVRAQDGHMWKIGVVMYVDGQKAMVDFFTNPRRSGTFI